MTIAEQSKNKNNSNNNSNTMEEELAGSIELFKTEDEPGKMSIREEDDDVDIEKAANTNNNSEDINSEKVERTSTTTMTSSSAALSGEEQQSNTNSTTTNNNSVNISNRFPFPQAFYDPVTKMIMLDPVVHPDGVSHEKNEDTDVKCYPNRAMKALIEQELDRYSDEGSVRAMVQDLGDNLRSGWNKLMERSALPAAASSTTGGEDRVLPEPFYCPISFELIHQPVIDPDGHTYEKAAIEHWIRANGDSPVTRQTLTVDELRENKAMFSVLTELAEGDDETMHPSIRKWKEDHSNLQFLTIVPLGGSTDEGGIPGQYGLGGDGTHQGGGAGSQFPITQAELDERRRQRRQNNCTTFGILLACLIVFLFFPSYFFLFTIIIACAWFLHEPYRNRQQQLRRAAIRQAAIQDLQREQQQREEQQRIQLQQQQQQQVQQQLQQQQQGLSTEVP